MSWIQKLCETYENAARTDAVLPDDANPLPAPGFIVGEMPLIVTLTADGRFLYADRISEEKSILLPCTLKSGVARQNPVSPHPLFDSVKYLGTDEQIRILSDWCDFNAPEPVRAVRTYLLAGALKDDLEKALTPKKVKFKDGDGVRFSVLGAQPSELWRNGCVLDSWREYFEKRCLPTAKEALCYTLGRTLPTAEKHPTAFSTLMLISMTTGYNCEGRFVGKTENALSVSADATLKAHSTLKWLIRRQGRYLDQSTVLLTWGTGAEKLPVLTDYDPEDEFAPVPQKATPRARTQHRQAEAVADGSQGYESRTLDELAAQAQKNKKSGERSDVVVMVLDSTSGKGRASIAYYQELDMLDYLDNLYYWYDSCKWTLRRWRDGQADEKPRTPLPREIGELIYGEQNGEGDKKLKRQLTKRLIPSITARRPIPPDIAEAAFRRTANPTGFRKANGSWDKYNWERAVAVTCALVRKYYKDHEKEEHPMELDDKSTERNYLYGRLLAVADVAEERAVSKSEAASRQTNAIRYMQRFQQRPMETWNTLRSSLLNPYLKRLRNSGSYYTWLIDEITAKFEPGDMALQKPLDGRFLEGYSNQKKRLCIKNTDGQALKETNNEEDDNNGGSDE